MTKGKVIRYSIASLHLNSASTPQRSSASTNRPAFTVLELLVVIAIIVILTGLILSIVGYVQKKAARARAETEIAAMSAALESYKADNGVYPRDPTVNTATDRLNARTDGNPLPSPTTVNTATDRLNARTDGNPLPSPTPVNPSGATYPPASLVLYRALSGDRNLDRSVTAADENFDIDGSPLGTPLGQLPRSYFVFKPNMLNPADQSQNVQYLRDPFGNAYGYSTANQYNPSTGNNPTFDLWSTAGLTTNPPSAGTDTITPQWIKNW